MSPFALPSGTNMKRDFATARHFDLNLLGSAALTPYRQWIWQALPERHRRACLDFVGRLKERWALVLLCVGALTLFPDWPVLAIADPPGSMDLKLGQRSSRESQLAPQPCKNTRFLTLGYT